MTRITALRGGIDGQYFLSHDLFTNREKHFFVHNFRVISAGFTLNTTGMFLEVKRLHKRLTIKLGIFSLVAAGVVVVVMLATVSVPKQSRFCTSCHGDVVFTNACKKLPSGDIACQDCHNHENSGAVTADLVNTVNAFATMDVIIKNRYCTQESCHPLNTLTSAESRSKKITPFEHKTHMIDFRENLSMRCTSCHANLGREKHFQTDTRTCNTCHFVYTRKPLYTYEGKPVSDCTVCHKNIEITRDIYGKTFSHREYEKEKKIGCADCHFNIVRGKGAVDEASCSLCHSEETGPAKDASRMHYYHVVKNKTSCTPCHASINHGWVRENAGDGKTRSILHFTEAGYEVQSSVMRGAGGKGIQGLPDPMYLATVNCSACHRDGFYAGVNPDVCVACHDRGFNKILAEQKLLVSSMMKLLSSLVKTAANHQTPDTLPIIREAEFNYEFVAKDGSYGSHNIKYVKDLLGYSIEQLRQIIRKNKRLNNNPS